MSPSFQKVFVKIIATTIYFNLSKLVHLAPNEFDAVSLLIVEPLCTKRAIMFHTIAYCTSYYLHIYMYCTLHYLPVHSISVLTQCSISLYILCQ